MTNPQLPLIDLHRHLDGNIRAKTIWQLAQQHQIALPTDDFSKFLPYVQIQQSEPDLLAFLSKLDWGVNVLKTLDDCKRVAYENVEDVFNEGIDYAELRFSPYYMAMKHSLDVADVVAAVIDGVQAGLRDFDTHINLIGILSRTFGAEKCQHELDAILAHRNSIIAVDLAGDEYNYPGELFINHFSLVKKADLQITIHAGEAAGSDSIWQAINELGATRIGHGVACKDAPKLMEHMHQNNIAIESCITSNYQTGTIKQIKNHPITTFLDNDLLVCLNTDDPAVENTELKKEFQIASTEVGLSSQQIEQLQKNALTASFLSTSEKQRLLNKKQQ